MVAQRVALCSHQLPVMWLMHDGMLMKHFFAWKLCFSHKKHDFLKYFSENGEKLCFFDLQFIVISSD